MIIYANTTPRAANRGARSPYCNFLLVVGTNHEKVLVISPPYVNKLYEVNN